MVRDVRCGKAPERPYRLQDPYLLAALSGASVLLLAATFPLWGDAWRVACPLRALTGVPCPTCFGTRAMLAVVGGRWDEAMRLNPLVAAGGISLLALVPVAGLIGLFGLPRPCFSTRALTRAAWAAAALTVLNWAYLVVVHYPA